MEDDPLCGLHWYEDRDVPETLEAALFTVVVRSVLSGGYEPIGTGFIVEKRGDLALALTAAHVLTAVRDHQHHRRAHRSALFVPSPPSIDVELKRLALVSKVQSRPIVSSVQGLALDEKSDIGVMEIGAQPSQRLDYPVRRLMVSDESPEIGQIVSILSYAYLTNTRLEADSGDIVRIGRIAVIRSGRVTNVFEAGEHHLCLGRCFETSIPVFSGMSGGPAFLYSAAGLVRVIGMVSNDPDSDASFHDKRDMAQSGRSIVAQLPVRVRYKGQDLAEVALGFNHTAHAGSFSGTFGTWLHPRTNDAW